MDYNNVPNNYQPNTEKQPPNGLAIASMILGILSIILIICYGIGIIFGIVSIILGILSNRASKCKLSGMALAGIICSAAGIILSIIYLIIMVFTFRQMMENGGYENFYDLINSFYSNYY